MGFCGRYMYIAVSVYIDWEELLWTREKGLLG